MGYLFKFVIYICALCKYSILHIYKLHIFYIHRHMICACHKHITYLYAKLYITLIHNIFYIIYKYIVHYLFLFRLLKVFFSSACLTCWPVLLLSLEPWTISNQMCICSFYELRFIWGEFNTAMQHGFIPHLFRTKITVGHLICYLNSAGQLFSASYLSLGITFC